MSTSSVTVFAVVQICGEANVGVIREAAQAGVPRCAFVSVHDYKFPGTPDLQARPEDVYSCCPNCYESVHIHAFFC